MNNFLKKLPYFFIYTRMLSAPVNILIATRAPEYSYVIGILLVYCALNDIFDGVIARFTGTDTTFMRVLDSVTDLIYVISIYTSVYLLAPADFATIRPLFLTLLGFEIANYLFCFIHFKRAPSAHNFLAKFFGIYSAFVFVIYFFTGSMNAFIQFSFILGMIARADAILIYLILKKWTHDIPSSYHATLINKGIPFKKSKWFHSETD